MNLTKDQVVEVFRRMVAESDDRASNVRAVDPYSEFVRDVTVIMVEVPNEILEQYVRR